MCECFSSFPQVLKLWHDNSMMVLGPHKLWCSRNSINTVISDPAHRWYTLTKILCYQIYLSYMLSCVNVNHILMNRKLESKMCKQRGHVSCWQRFVLLKWLSIMKIIIRSVVSDYPQQRASVCVLSVSRRNAGGGNVTSSRRAAPRRTVDDPVLCRSDPRHQQWSEGRQRIRKRLIVWFWIIFLFIRVRVGYTHIVGLFRDFAEHFFCTFISFVVLYTCMIIFTAVFF